MDNFIKNFETLEEKNLKLLNSSKLEKILSQDTINFEVTAKVKTIMDG